MINFIKGIIAGIGNIIPGLSGSALLIITGLYEKCLDAISNIFKDFKKSVLFLIPIGLGICVGTFVFSNIIEYTINNYLVITYITFVGFLIGTIPSLFKEANKNGFNKKYLIPLIITFSIGVSLLFVDKASSVSTIDLNFLNIIKLMGLGLVIAGSTIIPGISSTVLLNMLGFYKIYLNAINTLNIAILIPIFIGLALGAFILSSIINKLLKNYYGYTFYAILGFVIATIPELLRIPISFNIDLLIGLILGTVAFIITINIEKLANKNID